MRNYRLVVRKHELIEYIPYVKSYAKMQSICRKVER